AHYMRAAEYWHREVRLDGITSHREALDLMKEKAASSKPGEWVVVLGGWSEEQFVDEPRGFSRTELDAIAPNNRDARFRDRRVDFGPSAISVKSSQFDVT